VRSSDLVNAGNWCDLPAGLSSQALLVERHGLAVIKESLDEPIRFICVQSQPVPDNNILEQRAGKHGGLRRPTVDQLRQDTPEGLRRAKERRNYQLLQRGVDHVRVVFNEGQQQVRRDKRRWHLSKIKDATTAKGNASLDVGVIHQPRAQIRIRPLDRKATARGSSRGTLLHCDRDDGPSGARVPLAFRRAAAFAKP
jgi:hypothetical protein